MLSQDVPPLSVHGGEHGTGNLSHYFEGHQVCNRWALDANEGLLGSAASEGLFSLAASGLFSLAAQEGLFSFAADKRIIQLCCPDEENSALLPTSRVSSGTQTFLLVGVFQQDLIAFLEDTCSFSV